MPIVIVKTRFKLLTEILALKEGCIKCPAVCTPIFLQIFFAFFPTEMTLTPGNKCKRQTLPTFKSLEASVKIKLSKRRRRRRMNREERRLLWQARISVHLSGHSSVMRIDSFIFSFLFGLIEQGIRVTEKTGFAHTMNVS